ncbi:MAG: hypothetical protein IJ853_03350 [Rickettsiales bacterium]|nr:hypothetical protein [Rickettsiales bacterium]
MAENNNNILHTLAEEYLPEIRLARVGVPLSKSTISSLKELSKTDSELSYIVELANSNINIAIDEERLKKAIQRLETIRNEIEVRKLKYYENEQEREKYKVYFHDDKLCYLRKNKFVPIDTENEYKDVFGRLPLEDEDENIPEHRRGKSCFSCCVIDAGGGMYLFPYKGDTMQHTFITKGQPTQFAGMMRTKNGQICYIDNNSGHYKFGSGAIPVLYDKILQLSGSENIPQQLFAKGFNPRRTEFPESKRDCRNTRGVNFTNGFQVDAINKTQEQLNEERERIIRYHIQQVNQANALGNRLLNMIGQLNTEFNRIQHFQSIAVQ